MWSSVRGVSTPLRLPRFVLYMTWPCCLGGGQKTFERWSKPFSLGLMTLLRLRVGFRNVYATNVFAYAVMFFLT